MRPRRLRHHAARRITGLRTAPLSVPDPEAGVADSQRISLQNHSEAKPRRCHSDATRSLAQRYNDGRNGSDWRNSANDNEFGATVRRRQFFAGTLRGIGFTEDDGLKKTTSGVCGRGRHG